MEMLSAFRLCGDHPQVPNKRFKQMTHPLDDICGGHEKAVWHFERHYGRSTLLG